MNQDNEKLTNGSEDLNQDDNMPETAGSEADISGNDTAAAIEPVESGQAAVESAHPDNFMMSHIIADDDRAVSDESEKFHFYNAESGEEIFKHRKQRSPLPTKWLSFYSTVWLGLFLAGGLFGLISLFTSGDIKNLMGQQETLVIIVTVALVLITVIYTVALPLYLLISFRSLTKKCFFVNRIFLILLPGLEAFNIAMGLESNAADPVWMPVLLYAIPAIIFCALNFIYFEKRRFMFDFTEDYPQRQDEKVVTKRVTKPVIICTAISLVFVCLNFPLAFLEVDSTPSFYASPDLNNMDNYAQNGSGYQSSAPVDTTTDEVITQKFDEIAVLWGFQDHSDLMTALSETDVSNDPIKDQVEAFALLLELSPFEDAQGYLNPYTNESIDTYEDYMGYLYDCVEDALTQAGQ